MTKRSYPYKAWTLMPSFKPVEVELVGNYDSSLGYQHMDVTAKGKIYFVGQNLWPSKEAAIAAGRDQLKAQQADLDKRQERLNKRTSALDKADQP